MTPARKAPGSVLLCVTGSIAAYKAAELARLFIREGVQVQVAMTEAATEFVGPLTFEAITGNPVYVDIFGQVSGPTDQYGPGSGKSSPNGSRVTHVEMSKAPDLVLVAPATADVIGKMAAGFADDIVTTSILAADAPVWIAPAMNQRMWANPIVKDNVARLSKAGVKFLGPESGDLACGETGPGRMMEPAAILAEFIPSAKARLADAARGTAPTAPAAPAAPAAAPAAAEPAAAPVKPATPPPFKLSGKILVTVGRTEEMLDPVRYISNRSSGRMGVAIATAARDAGADVTVVAGPTAVPLPDGVTVHNVRTADQMRDAVAKEFPNCDALIMVAAVSDYRAATEKLHKMESGQKLVSVDLEPNEDILESLKGSRKKQVMVGFALETQAEEQRGREKLNKKGLDLIVVNNPLKEGSEFGGETNLVTFLHRSGQTQRLPVAPKAKIAWEILAQVAYLMKTPAGKAPPKVDVEALEAAAAAAAGAAKSGTTSSSSSASSSRSRGGRGRGGRGRRTPRKKTVASSSGGEGSSGSGS